MNAMDVSAAGMRAQRLRMDLIAGNLANVDTTSARREVRRGADGTAVERHVPYARRIAVFHEAGGLPVGRVVEDDAPFRAESLPSHPHAVPAGEPDAGTVYHPNVHPIAEMVDMMAASRAYEANVTALDASKTMAAAALRILA